MRAAPRTTSGSSSGLHITVNALDLLSDLESTYNRCCDVDVYSLPKHENTAHMQNRIYMYLLKQIIRKVVLKTCRSLVAHLLP